MKSIYMQYITIEWLRYGQPKAYSDSFYEAILSYSANGNNKWNPDEKTVKEHARLLVHSFVDNGHPLENRLEEIKKLTPNEWKILIVSPYCD